MKSKLLSCGCRSVMVVVFVHFPLNTLLKIELQNLKLLEP